MGRVKQKPMLEMPRAPRMLVAEREVQKAFCDALKLRGWLFTHHPDSRRMLGTPGMPDVVAVNPKTGEILFVECKGLAGRLSDDQKVWAAAILGSDAAAYAYVTPKNCEKMVDVILGCKQLSRVELARISELG